MTALKELSVSHSLTREGQDGWTPLHEAAFCGETEAVKMILKGKYTQRSRDGELPFLEAFLCLSLKVQTFYSQSLGELWR